MHDAIDDCFVHDLIDLLWEVGFSAVGDARCVISDVGPAVVLMVTLLFAVDTRDAIFVGVITGALVCRVVQLL